MWRIKLRIYLHLFIGILTLPLVVGGFVTMWLGVALSDGIEAGNDQCDKHNEFTALRSAKMHAWIDQMHQSHLAQAVEKLRKAAGDNS